MKMWTEPVESEKTLYKGPSRVGENPVRSPARDLGEKIALMPFGCVSPNPRGFLSRLLDG